MTIFPNQKGTALRKQWEVSKRPMSFEQGGPYGKYVSA
jgi:hypothetical protein